MTTDARLQKTHATLRVLLGQDAIPGVAARASREDEPTRPARFRLFGLSFLMLFAELALIRWTGAKIVYLSYFSNFVLLGSFLGIGVGFLLAFVTSRAAGSRAGVSLPESLAVSQPAGHAAS